MRVICVQDFGNHVPGDIIEVPDGSEVAPGWFRPLTDAENAALDAPPAEDAGGIEPEHDFQEPPAAGTDTKKGKG